MGGCADDGRESAVFALRDDGAGFVGMGVVGAAGGLAALVGEPTVGLGGLVPSGHERNTYVASLRYASGAWPKR